MFRNILFLDLLERNSVIYLNSLNNPIFMKHKAKSPKEDINLNQLGVIFFLGLLLLFGTYFIFYDPERYLKRAGISVINLPSTMHNLGNRFSSPVKEFALAGFDFKSCENCDLSATFEDDDALKVKYSIPHHNKNRLSIFVHKVLERTLNIPVDYGWVNMGSKVPNADWSMYNGANLFVNNGGEPGRLEFAIGESDGDMWYYFDETSLNNRGDIAVYMPFNDFFHPSWAPYGDGKKDFCNVTMFTLTITSFDKAVNNTINFKLTDGNFISLE